jgi:hypothetical protein
VINCVTLGEIPHQIDAVAKNGDADDEDAAASNVVAGGTTDQKECC